MADYPDDIEDIADIPVAELAPRLLEIAARLIRFAVRLRQEQHVAMPRPSAEEGGDELLKVEEASRLSGLSVDQLYRRPGLAFRIKIGEKQTRFSRRGIERWKRTRTG